MSAGSYCKRQKWGQQKPPLGYQLDRLSPFASGLVGCWLFNEGAGAIANDIVHGAKSTLTGNTVWMPGVVKIAAENTAYITTQRTPALSPVRCTVIIWFEPISIGSGCLFAFGSDEGTGFLVGYDYGLGSGWRFYSRVSAGWVTAVVDVGPYNIMGRKVMMSQSWDGSNTIVHIDGKFAGSQAGTPSDLLYSTNTDMRLGNYGGTQNSYKFHSMAIFNTAMQTDQLKYLYANPYAMVEGYNLGRFFSVPSGIVYTSSLPAIIAVNSNEDRIYDGNRISTLNISTSANNNRLFNTIKTASSSITTSANNSRAAGIVRGVSQSITGNATVVRVVNGVRNAVAKVTTNQTLNRLVSAVRNVRQSITTNTTLNRVVNSFRNVSQSINISNIVTGIKSGIQHYLGPVYASLAVSANNTRRITLSKTASAKLSVSSNLNRLVNVFRNISSKLTINSTLSRVFGVVKNLRQSIQINSNLNRLINLIKTLSANVSINTTTTRLQNVLRTISATIHITATEFDTWISNLKHWVKDAYATITVNATNTRRTTLTRILSTVISVKTSVRASYFVKQIIKRFNRLFGRGIGPD